jgi:hypothetical protein
MNSAGIGIMINRKITAADDVLIARMKAALNQPRLMPRHRQMLHFALGKAHDDRGEYESAMRNFDEGRQARQPIYQTSVELWRRYEPWLGELRELAPETMASDSLSERRSP